jgi:hypothetical protein
MLFDDDSIGEPGDSPHDDIGADLGRAVSDFESWPLAV